MNKIQLLKEPGYIYDLYYIFCLKFNNDLYLSITDENDKAEYLKDVKEISSRFGEIPDDLYVFFHAIESRRAFLPNFYFTPYKELFATTFNFKFLLKELTDQDKLLRNLIKFYLYELNEEEIDECMNSIPILFNYIKSSHYSNEEKSKLYEFFINPVPYIQTLQFELLEKEALLSDYYRNNYQKIIDAHNETTIDKLVFNLNKVRSFEFLNSDSQVLSTSYCLLNKYLISFYYVKSGVDIVIGYNYDISNVSKKKKPNLNDFCFALCEESRVKILRFLFDRGEVSCKDLEKEFTFSGSTAYHHINIMTRLGLVKTRNEGKTILYSINNNYIYDINNILKTFMRKKETKK